MKKSYDLIVRVPRFLLMVATGALGSLVMRLMHRGDQVKQNKPEPTPSKQIRAKPAPASPTGQPTPPTTPSKKGKGKKGGKK